MCQFSFETVFEKFRIDNVTWLKKYFIYAASFVQYIINHLFHSTRYCPIITENAMTEEVKLLISSQLRPECSASEMQTAVSQLGEALYVNPSMLIGSNCIYTAALPSELASNFPEGTVLRILDDSSIVAVPLKETDSQNSSVASFTSLDIEMQASSAITTLLEEQVNCNASDTALARVENISDIDFNFLNESVEATNLKNSSHTSTKDLQGIMTYVSSNSDDVLQSQSISKDLEISRESSPAAETDNSQENVVMIDVSKPIQLAQNSLIMVNGQKCVLQQDLQTGQVLAFPVKEQEKTKRRRGRPRKSSFEKSMAAAVTEDESLILLEPDPEPPPEDSLEKGLLEVVNDDGSLIRRSTRRRKTARALKDYETGNLKHELGSDVDEAEIIKETEESHKKKYRAPGRPRKHFESALLSALDTTPKRQRGRPRKHAPLSEPTQAFLVQTADGQTLMMQVPVSSIPPGVSLQEVAQSIANRLNVGLAHSNTVLTDEEKNTLSSSQKGDSKIDLKDSSISEASDLAIQDHSIGSTTNFNTLDAYETETMPTACEELVPSINSVIVEESISASTEENLQDFNSLQISNSSHPKSLLEETLLITSSELSNFGDSHLPDSNIPIQSSSSTKALSCLSTSTSLNESIELEDNMISLHLPKDFLDGDFMKDKVSIQLLLQNVVNPTTLTSEEATINNNGPSAMEEQASIVECSSSKISNESSAANANSYITGSLNLEVTTSELYSSDLASVSKDSLQASIIDSINHDHDFQINKAPEPLEETQVPKVGDSNTRKKVQTFRPIMPSSKGFASLQEGVLTGENVLSTILASVIPVDLTQKQFPLVLSSVANTLNCMICQRIFLSEEDLINHFKAEHPKCICMECNFMAEHPYVIKRHSYRHAENGCVCSICGKTYKDFYILKMHIKMVHLPAEIMFSCNICNKKFTRKAHLKRHLRIHAPDKPYQCPYCEYRGCEKSDITKHRLIHEEPRHKCQLCDKAFRHIKNKELHLKRHYKQRDYKCGICDFYGYTFTDIRKHIERRHADSKAFACPNCGLVMQNKEKLEEHQKENQCDLLHEESSQKVHTSINEEMQSTSLLEECLASEMIDEPTTYKVENAVLEEVVERKSEDFAEGHLVLAPVDASDLMQTQESEIVINCLDESDLLTPIKCPFVEDSMNSKIVR